MALGAKGPALRISSASHVLAFAFSEQGPWAENGASHKSSNAGAPGRRAIIIMSICHGGESFLVDRAPGISVAIWGDTLLKSYSWAGLRDLPSAPKVGSRSSEATERYHGPSPSTFQALYQMLAICLTSVLGLLYKVGLFTLRWESRAQRVRSWAVRVFLGL